MLVIPFPPIDPVALSLGPLVVRWYALAYVAGFVAGWRLCLRWGGAWARHYDDFMSWSVLGVILGGRLGYILFYQFAFYVDRPWEILKLWHGGMSFHGGMLGVAGAAWLFTRGRKIDLLAFTDVLARITPIGLGLGRLANFVNGELWGRVTDMPWGVIFPHGGPLPRHPSQLYEAVLEGPLLYLALALLARKQAWRARPGFLSGAFLLGYGLARFGAEFFREPDPQLGFLLAGSTMGQVLCVPMMGAGLWLMRQRRPT